MYHIKGKWKYAKLRSHLQLLFSQNIKLVGKNAYDTVLTVVNLLESMHQEEEEEEEEEELYLEKFDCVIFHANGLDILHIVNQDKNCNRSVFVNLDIYRNKLLHFWNSQKNCQKRYFQIIAIGCSVSVATSLLFHYHQHYHANFAILALPFFFLFFLVPTFSAATTTTTTTFGFLYHNFFISDSGDNN